MIYIGILVGFYGYLFPGNINLMVVNLFHNKQYRQLLFTLLLILVFESLYSILTLLFLKSVFQQPLLYHGIEIFSLLLLSFLGIWMIIDHKKELATAKSNTTKRGLFSIIIHPQQIPFWMAVSTLFSRVIYTNMYLFITFNAVGVFLIMITYMFLGKLLINYFKVNLKTINKIIGIAYICISVYSIVHLVLIFSH